SNPNHFIPALTGCSMRLSFLTTIFLCLTLSCCTTTGSNNSVDGNGQGASLSCFSVTSPAGLAALSAADRGPRNAEPPLWIEGSTCDAMCASQGAACTA